MPWNSQVSNSFNQSNNYEMFQGSNHVYQPPMQNFSQNNNNLSYQQEQQFTNKISMYNNNSYYPNYINNGQHRFNNVNFGGGANEGKH